MRVLVVEDSRSLAEVLVEGPRDQGIHGDTLCQMVTVHDERAMVLMLTAAGAPGDRVRKSRVSARRGPA